MCGVRVGYLWSRDQDLVNRAIEIKTHTSMNTNLVGQDMALRAMDTPSTYIEEQLVVWRERRELIFQGLRDLGLDLWKPEGAFYVLPKVRDPVRLVEALFLRHQVVTYLGDWFGAPDRIRLSYALASEDIERGIERIRRCLAELE